jgi:hypothetical protein
VTAVRPFMSAPFTCAPAETRASTHRAWFASHLVYDAGFRVWGLELEDSDVGFRAWGSTSRMLGLGLRVEGFGFEVSDVGFRVWGSRSSM